LTYAAIVTQQATAHQSYQIQNPQNIKMIGPDQENEKLIVINGSAVGGDSLHKYQYK
jgi:hypothetical protein